MSGHSKWAQIKRSKGVADVKRGAVFTKLAREITLASRAGLPDPDLNFRLRLAVQHARENNMPAENIERAIKRASGAHEGAAIEEIYYEGYGPGGVALLIQSATDNRNRTVAEIRSTLSRAGGSLGEAGSVSWQFENRGVITCAPDGMDPDELSLMAIDAGADDAKVDVEEVIVYTEPGKLEDVKKALEGQKVQISEAEVSMVSTTDIALDEKDAIALMKLVDRLEDLDDVQHVYNNAEFDVEIFNRLES
jgi:YebC/PmpR family DNA-binding regulatory protein